MRFSRHLLAFAVVGTAACGPTYVVQQPPSQAPQRVPPPPRVQPLEVNIVRPDEGRVLVQTSRPAYVAVFEIVPGRGVSLVYPRPYRPRDVMLTGLTWVDVYWTMRPDYDRRFASSDTRYIYAVASDTPLRLTDEDYDRSRLERRLGTTFWSQSPNATVRAISREFVRAQPEEWWGEDMYAMTLTSTRVTVTIRLVRVYCPGGEIFDVREDLVNRIWCPARRGGYSTPRGTDRPVAMQPDSVTSNGRRVPRHMDPSQRTPVFRVPPAVDVGQHNQPQTNQPQTPVQNPPQTQPTTPPQTQPPQNQPPQTQPPQSPPPQNPPQDPRGKDHDDNGRRAHGDPQNADPRGNGNGYGNGGRDKPATQPPPSTPTQSNPQPQQQGQPKNDDHGNDKGKNPNEAKPDHSDAPKTGIGAFIKARGPQNQKQDDKDKKAASDSTDKKKP